MSLIQHWCFHYARELEGTWCREIRETVAPIVFDVGSNLGQFGRLVRSLNPGAQVITWDAWPEMAAYVPMQTHRIIGLAAEPAGTMLIWPEEGWTASSGGKVVDVNMEKARIVKRTNLDTEWQTLKRPEVAVLKIDVDGGELEVLKGARDLLPHVRTVIVETVRFEQVKALCPGRKWSSVNNVDWQGTVL